LVLDEDVHRTLKKKKKETGINVKDLGNCALRSALERPLLAEVIGRNLIASGCLTEEEFESIRDESVQQLRSPAEDLASIVHQTKRDTFATGSWEIKEMVRDATGDYQVLSAWVKDHRMRPAALHKHEGVEFLIVLTGAILISIDVVSQIVRAPGILTIPGGAVHSATPLERKTRMLAVISPPEPVYPIKEEA